MRFSSFRLPSRAAGIALLGAISEDSDRPLERHAIDPPRPEPGLPPAELPPYEFADRMEEYGAKWRLSA